MRAAPTPSRDTRFLLRAQTPDPNRAAAIKAEIGGNQIIGHMGALHDHHKCQLILIAAFKLLTSEYLDARLLTLGEGLDKQAFQHQANGDPRIIFAGFQSNAASWIAAMDVFAFPSREEGLGSSVLDAMKLGVPVITSSAGGLPELVGANERGLLLESKKPEAWADAIKRIFKDPTLRKRLCAPAAEFADAHDKKAMVKHYLNLYRRII